MTSDRKRWVLCLLTWVGFAGASFPKPIHAQDAAAPTGTIAEVVPSEQVTADELQALREQIQNATDLSDDARKAAAEAVQSGLASLKSAQELAAKTEQYTKDVDSIASTRKKKEDLLNKTQSESESKPGNRSSLTQMETELAEKQQQLIDAQAQLDQAARRMDERTERQKAIKDRLAAIPAELDAVNQALAAPPPADEPPLLTQAKRKSKLADRQKLEKEPLALQKEQAAMAAIEAATLWQLDRQYWTLRVDQLKQQVADWTQAILRKKRTDAQHRANVARTAAENAEVDVLKDLYANNADIVERELQVHLDNQEIYGAETDNVDLETPAGTPRFSSLGFSTVTSARRLREILTQEFDQLKSREKRIGSSTVFGIRLREQRPRLPDPVRLRRAIKLRVPRYEEAQLEYLNLRDQLQSLDSIDQQVEQSLAQIPVKLREPGEERDQLVRELRKAYEQRRDNLNQLLTAYDNYSNSLEMLEEEQNQLAELSTEFRKYIDERILWIPSNSMLTWQEIIDDAPSLQRFASGKYWSELWIALRTDCLSHPAIYLLAIFIWIGLIVTHGRQRKAIRNLGQKAASRLNTSMSPTWRALMWTIVRSLIVPMPILFFSWRGTTVSEPRHVTVLCESLRVLAIWVWWLEFVRHTCRTQGLGPAHFQWTPRVNKIIVRQLASFLVLGTPLFICAVIFNSRSTDGDSDAISRVVGIAFLILFGFTLHRLTSRKHGIVQEWTVNHEGGWVDRLSSFWHLLAVCVPLALGGLIFAGYRYAATSLSVKLAQTLMIVFAAVFIRSLLFRWLTLRQRRLAIEQARELRAAMASQNKTDAANDMGVSSAKQEAQEARANLADVSAQSKRLLNTTIVVTGAMGLWLIWSDVLPALRYFDEWKLFGSAVSVAGLFNALIAAVLVATAARNVPGLLEITLLERLPLDRSVRYAVGAITRYAIVIVGILAISHALSLGWEQVQWMAAALTVGLGFGLNEIFANFISGLIILFEQPVRVGDIVTIDTVTGSVTRIRIRSTTIMDWDRKEYIVPNKEFITGRLLNWTLSDTVNRVVINVGVTYSADPRQVREILMSIIKSQQYILVDPAPVVTFEGFGESSLNFVVRAYLPVLEYRLETITSLHMRIFEALKEAGIEIPFPQRDLHVRSLVPIPRAMANGELHEEVGDENGELDEQESPLYLGR